MTQPSSAHSPVLTAADHEHFLLHGFVHLTDCFDTSPGSIAHRWVQESWARNGFSADDRSMWPNDKIGMHETERMPTREFSPKAYSAICDLCGGADRIHDFSWGNQFIANYGWGRDQEWVAPSAEARDWHVDGDFFVHFLDSAEQALLVVVLFTDIHPKGGGTFIACDSPPIIARDLAAHPEGYQIRDFRFKEYARQSSDFRETTGNAGDVFLLHPFMLHASSYNHRPEARLMINPVVGFRKPMRFDRRSDGSSYSPVEKLVLNALGMKNYNFQITSPRQRIVPEREAHQRELLAKEKARLAALP